MYAPTGRKVLAAAGGLLLAGHRLAAQAPPPEAPAPPPAVAETAPPIGSDFPLWLRRPGDVPDRPESGGEPRREERREGEIETDRDSFTPAISTAGRGLVVVESRTRSSTTATWRRRTASPSCCSATA
jgi:hypothetical protein